MLCLKNHTPQLDVLSTFRNLMRLGKEWVVASISLVSLGVHVQLSVQSVYQCSPTPFLADYQMIFP